MRRKEWVKITIRCTNMDLVYNVEIKNKNKTEWWVVGKREFDIPTNAGVVRKVTGDPPECFAQFAKRLCLPVEPTDVDMNIGNASIVLNSRYCTFSSNCEDA